jgi:hypothetical protein
MNSLPLVNLQGPLRTQATVLNAPRREGLANDDSFDDKSVLSRMLRLRKGVLHVKEILSQPIVSGWDLIPVASSRLRTSTNADYCL